MSETRERTRVTAPVQATGAGRAGQQVLLLLAGVIALAVAISSVNGRVGPIERASLAQTSCTPTRSAPGPLIDLGVRATDLGGPLNDATIGSLLGLADRAGASIISTQVSWRSLRPDPSAAYDWTALDAIVDAVGAAGKRVRLQLVGMPRWAVTGPASDATWRPPLTDQEVTAWSAFVSDVMRHVRGRVDYLEVWDEPNQASHWSSGPDPRAFSALLRATYPVVKRIDPDVVVISGGISDDDLGYVSGLYRSLDDSSGERRPFDMLGLHPGTGTRGSGGPGGDDGVALGGSDPAFAGSRRVHELMRDHGDGERDVYIGDLGGTVPPPGDGTARARRLTETMESATCTPYVFVVSWQLHPSAGAPAAWTMLDSRLRPTPTLGALEAWSRRVDAVRPH